MAIISLSLSNTNIQKEQIIISIFYQSMQSAYLPQQEEYHQLSELILLQNPPIPDISLHSQISEIMHWIQSPSTRPLLITAEKFGGKKVLICELIRHLKERNGQKKHQKQLTGNGRNQINHNQDSILMKDHLQFVVISQFASVTPYYSDILYKIMSKLRVFLNVQQKVQLNQQKLRQYFRYWLEIADEKIEKQFLSYIESEKPKIVIIIEGVDKVVDSKKQLVNPSFWFPDIKLRNIKIILTSLSSAPNLDQLVETKIQHVLSVKKVQLAKKKIYEDCSFLKEVFPPEKNDIHFSDLKMAREILVINENFQKYLKNGGNSFEEFQKFFIEFIKFISPNNAYDRFHKFLACLIWNKKGLNRDTLRRVSKLNRQEIQDFLVNISPFVSEYKKYYLIMNPRVKTIILNYIVPLYNVQKSQRKQSFINIQVSGSSQRDQQGLKKSKRCKINEGSNENEKKLDLLKNQIHYLISQALKKESGSVSILEETIYHLKQCGDFTQLKELLSRIQNFLVLYTPLTKHTLCVIWLQLENQFQYDPVFEYNKAIQRFLNHYYPSHEDTFKIIFQLSLFFKEYAEFQNSKTPDFRHPPIRGEIQLMKEISIFEELLRMKMFEKSKQRIKTENNQKSPKNMTERFSEASKAKQQKKSQLQQQNIDFFLKSGQSQLESGKQVEKLNVSIKFHQQKFRQFYMQEMEPYINEYYTLKKKYLMNKKDKLLDQDSDDSDAQIDETKIESEKEKIKKQLLLKKFSDYSEEVYHRKSQQRTFYYYKQWIWMQFPWICQSLKNDYSRLIDECVKSPTEYMSIEKQSRLIEQALKIATMAKQNKDHIYQKTNVEVNPIQAQLERKKQKQRQIKKRKQKLKNKKSQKEENLAMKQKGQSSHQVLKSRKKLEREQSNHKRSITKGHSIDAFRKKLDVSQLDGEIEQNLSILAKKKGKKYQLTQQQNSSVFMTDIGIVKSRIIDKQNNSMVYSPNNRFPAISKVSSLAATRLKAKNNQITEIREYQLLVTKLDEYKFENKKLMEKIQLLKQNAYQGNAKEQKKMSVLSDIAEFKNQLSIKTKAYENHKDLKNKLETIIKICDINKSHGSQSQHLSNFLNSLKLMFSLQTENLQKINKQMRYTIQQCKNTHKKLKEEKKCLQNRLKKQKSRQRSKVEINLIEKPTKKEGNASKGIKKQGSSTKIKSFQKNNKIKLEQTKKLQKIQTQKENLKKIEDFLFDNFGICHHQKPEDQQNFSKIMEQIQAKVDRVTQIQWQLNELKDQNSSKMQQLQNLKEEKNLIQSNQIHEKQQKKKKMENQFSQILSKEQKRRQCLVQCLYILEEGNNGIKNNKTEGISAQ